MTRVNFKLDDDGAVRYAALLETRARRALNARPAFETIADDIENLEDAVFRTQGRLLTGSGWRQDSAPQRAEKHRRGLADRVLEMATPGGIGRLRRSLTTDGAPWSVRKVTNDEAERGTSLGIARIHQTGGTATIRRGKRGTQQVRIPRRRFMQTRRVDRLRWLGVLEDHLQTGTSRPGRVL